MLIEGFRLWLTNDREINPKGYTFSETNLPATIVDSTHQKDGSSCGYFAIRNLIGMLVSYDSIFPIRIKDTTRKTGNIKKYRSNLHTIFKKNVSKRMGNITFKNQCYSP